MTDETQGNVPDEMHPAPAQDSVPQGKPLPDREPEDLDQDYEQDDQPAEATQQPAPENPSVTLEEDFSRPHPDGFKAQEWIIVPAGSREQAQEILESFQGAKTLSKETLDWLASINGGTYHNMPRDEMDRILAPNEKYDWGNQIEHEGRAISMRAPAVPSIPEGTLLVGANAAAHMARALNTSSSLSVPLHHTGIWLDFSVPADTELHLLEQQLAEHVYDLGYMANGQLYSGVMTMLNNRLMDWALDRVTGGTVKDLSKDYLKSIIRVNDIQAIAHGLATMAYPRGFPYSRACTANPTVCNHVEHAHLRLSKLMWVDRRALSSWQVKMLANRRHKMTEEDLERYQQEFVRGGERKVKLTDTISVVLAAPTLAQYEAAGYDWVEGIIDQTTKNLVNKTTEELNHIQHAQYVMTSMRQYAHWVNEIHYAGDITVTGRTEINDSLALASGNQGVVDTFMDAVRQHLEDSTVALVAIPTYDCPTCHAPQQTPGKRHPYLIPLDAVFVFFTLRDQRTRSSLYRNMGR